MLYYFKQTLYVLGLMLFMILTSSAIVLIETGWIKIALGFLNIILFSVAIYLSFYNDGVSAVKTIEQNNSERLLIIETGEDRKIERAKEYAPFKGFLFGLFACIPLVVLLIIHAILHATGSESIIVGQVAGFIYYVLFVPISAIAETVKYETFFYLLYAVVFLPIVTGIPYVMGARKQLREKEKLEEIKEKILGDNK